MNKIHKALLLSLTANFVIATDTASEDANDIGNWVATYHILDAEGVAISNVSHTPERVCLDNICANSINFSSQQYNGIPLSAPINISVDMEKPEFEASLLAAGLEILETNS